MMYQLNVSLTDKDYYNFNKFALLHAKSYRTIKLIARVLIVIMAMLGLLAVLIGQEEPPSAPIVIAAVAVWSVFCAVFQLILNPVMLFFLKLTLRFMRKNGKPGYDSSSVLTFDDKGVTDLSENKKTEQSYAAIERICVVGNETIYLYFNTVSAYIVPVAAFSSLAEAKAFLAFMNDKCGCGIEWFKRV